MKEYNTDVLIVGAGPTGLLLACELARQGIDFHIIDRSPKPSKLSRATGIHWLSLEILEDFGLSEKAVDEGFWLPATSVYRDGKLLKRIPLATKPRALPTEPAPSLLILEQEKTEALLTEHLATLGVELERRCELKGFTTDSDGVRATVARKRMLETWNCNYIVGCDGPKSQVRENLGIHFVGFTYPRPYLLAEVRMDWDLPAEMYRFIGETSDLLAVPLGGDLFRLTAWEKEDEVLANTSNGGDVHRTTGAAPTLEQVQEMVNQTVPGEAKVLEARTLLRYRIESRLALSYGQGRAFLAGDACHVHPPTGSQGLNTGFQDAYNLGWKLAAVLKGESSAELLQSYEKERRPVGHWVLTNTHQAAMSRFEMAGRRFFLMGDKLMVPRWNQSSVHYRESPIVAQMSKARKTELRAGDRASDGFLRKTCGEERRVHQILSGGRHHLLIFGGEGEELMRPMAAQVRESFEGFIDMDFIGLSSEGWPGGESWSDPDGAVTKVYGGGKKATAVLVRPDRYIGVKAGPHNAEQLLRYLEECFTLQKAGL